MSFMIGSEFKFKHLKKLGIKPLVIGLMSSFLTLLIVTFTSFACGMNYSFSLMLGAIASSTAPASIMMIMKQYKAMGELTNTILSVVAIDDVISIFLFGFAIVVAGTANGSLTSSLGLLEPFKEIVYCVILGSLLGFLIGLLTKIFKSDSNIIIAILSFILLSVMLSYNIGISSLLVCMVMGAVFVNVFNNKITNRVLDLIDYINPPFLIIFFVLAGASIDFSVLSSVFIISIIYILSRSIGKIFGAMLGCKLVCSSKKVYKYIGPTLLSQTGLAIGLVALAQPILGDETVKLKAIVITSSFLFDLIGPLIVKYCLNKASELKGGNV